MKIKSFAKSNLLNFASAFTFAELMISLVIIAVITAILYPTISEIAPNNNKHLFKSAYKTVEMVTSEIINDNANGELIPVGDGEDYTDGIVRITYSSGDGGTSGAQIICHEFRSKLNTISFTSTDCTSRTCRGCDQNANGYWFTTSNGMRWYFKNYDTANKQEEIFIDVNASNNSNDFDSVNSDSDNDNPNQLNSDQWNHGMFRMSDPTARDTFQILLQNNGKVSIGDDETIGQSHLLEQSN